MSSYSVAVEKKHTVVIVQFIHLFHYQHKKAGRLTTLRRLTFEVIKKIREEMIVRQIFHFASLIASGTVNDRRHLFR